MLGTRVISADTRRKTLVTATGETITYKFLIIATGARVIKVVLIIYGHIINEILVHLHALFLLFHCRH